MIVSALLAFVALSSGAMNSAPPTSGPLDSGPPGSVPETTDATPLATLNGLLATPIDSDEPVAADLVGVEPELWLDTGDDDLVNAVAGVSIGESSGVSYVVFPTAEVAEIEFAERVAPSEDFAPVADEPAGDGERVRISMEDASLCVERTGITMVVALREDPTGDDACALVDLAVAHLDAVSVSGAIPAPSDPPTPIDLLNTLLDPATTIVAAAAPAELVDYADPVVAASVGAARTTAGAATVTVHVFADVDQRDAWIADNGFPDASSPPNEVGTLPLESGACARSGDAYTVVVESGSGDACALADEASTVVAALASGSVDG